MGIVVGVIVLGGESGGDGGSGRYRGKGRGSGGDGGSASRSGVWSGEKDIVVVDTQERVLVTLVSYSLPLWHYLTTGVVDPVFLFGAGS